MATEGVAGVPVVEKDGQVIGVISEKDFLFQLGTKDAELFAMEYLKKMKGITKSPPPVSLYEIMWSWIGAFIGIIAVAYINYGFLDDTDLLMIIGSFGASVVLIYGAIKNPLAQP